MSKNLGLVEVDGVMDFPHVKVYTSNLDSIMIMSPYVRDVMFAILVGMKNGNTFVVNTSVKKKISAYLGYTVQTVHKAIKNLEERKVVIRLDNGNLFVNPFIFAKAEWENVKKLRRKFIKLIKIEVEKEVPNVEGESNE